MRKARTKRSTTGWSNDQGALMAHYNYYGDHCITSHEPGWFAEVELRYLCCINGIVTMHVDL